jgi:hypothetical protein
MKIEEIKNLNVFENAFADKTIKKRVMLKGEVIIKEIKKKTLAGRSMKVIFTEDGKFVKKCFIEGGKNEELFNSFIEMAKLPLKSIVLPTTLYVNRNSFVGYEAPFCKGFALNKVRTHFSLANYFRAIKDFIEDVRLLNKANIEAFDFDFANFFWDLNSSIKCIDANDFLLQKKFDKQKVLEDALHFFLDYLIGFDPENSNCKRDSLCSLMNADVIEKLDVQSPTLNEDTYQMFMEWFNMFTNKKLVTHQDCLCLCRKLVKIF